MCPALCHLYDLKEEALPNPVTMVILDSTSSSCPQEEVLVTLESILPEGVSRELAAQRLVALAEQLLNPEHEERFVLYVAKFCQLNCYYQKDERILQGGNWAIDLDEIFNSFKGRAGPSENYFRKEAEKNHREEEEEALDYYDNLIEKLDQAKEAASKSEMSEVETKLESEVEKESEQKPDTVAEKSDCQPTSQ